MKAKQISWIGNNGRAGFLTFKIWRYNEKSSYYEVKVNAETIQADLTDRFSSPEEAKDACQQALDVFVGELTEVTR